METFQDFNLPKKLLATLDKMNFKTPTDVQKQTIPLALEGEDIIGTAQTGTGKTGAFAIPLCAKMLEDDTASVVVMTPTRELATQVMNVFKALLADAPSIKLALLIGGDPMDKQLRQLKSRARVVVGTPGRMNDHLKRGTLILKDTHHLVLDETDLMLDMGFDIQIETIIRKLPQERQTLMFSATLPKKIESLAGKYLKKPVRISIGQQSTPGKGIKQDVLMTADHEKYDHLIDQLNTREGSSIIFVKTKRGADKLATKLDKEGYKVGAIHGDLRQNKRERVLTGFRNKKYTIMVATDVAARGIDVPHIQHVINYDLPQCPEDYIHRIGRTGRAGQTGAAISFVTHKEKGKWNAIERLLDPNAKHSPDPQAKRKPFGRRKIEGQEKKKSFGRRKPQSNRDAASRPSRDGASRPSRDGASKPSRDGASRKPSNGSKRPAA